MKKNWLLGLASVLGGWTATAQFHPHILQGRNPEFELLAPRAPSGFLINQHIFPYLIQKGNDTSKVFSTNHWYDGAHAIRQIAPSAHTNLIPGLTWKEKKENALAYQGLSFLSLVDIEMNHIDTSAAIDGRLFLDTQGRWTPQSWADTSFYLPFHAQFAGITAFQPPYDSVANRYSPLIQWVLPDTNLYHRGNGRVENIEINFFDGRGWLPVVPNRILGSDLRQMNHPGYLLFRWGDSAHVVVRKLAFGMDFATLQRMNQFLPTNTIPWSTVQGFHASLVHSRSGEARMYHFSPTEDSVIRKPVVFVEGYDPNPNQEPMRYGSIGANLRGGHIPKSNYLDTTNAYQQLIGFKHLADSILALGFDLIIVDFKNGAEEIEANAQALASCLGYLSSLPTKSADILLIGASMGGLTSRYALKKLEDARIRHCVGTWVSFDSPHLGANIPINYQALLRYLGYGSYTSEKKFNENVMVPAAMQMLVNHIDTLGSAVQVRQKWHQKQFQTGFPQKTKNVAITNGATNGHLIPLYPNEKHFDFDHKNQLKTDLWVNDTTQPNQQVMYAKINRLAPPHFAQWAFRTDVQYFEFTPGGKAETGKDLMDGLNEAFGTNVQFDREEYETHSFIPAQSALFDYSANPTASLVGRSNAVFQQVVHLSDTNERHVTVNSRTSTPLYALLQEHLDSVPLLLPNPQGAQFNLAADTRIAHDVVIQNGGNFWINGFQKVNYGMQFGGPAVFRNIKTEFSSCGHTWLVESGGTLQLGEQNGTPFPNNAKVKISEGSIMELKPGSTLKIENYSELIFEPGSALILHPGARIELNGSNALLSINSLIRLEDSATFELIGSGKMVYSVDTGIRNAIRAGAGCSWKMDARVHLEITDGAHLELPSNLKIAQFDQATVLFGHSSCLVIQSPCILKDSRFTSAWNGAGTHRGVQIFSTSASILHRNVFENGASGLIIHQKTAMQSAKVLRCQFLNNAIGLEAVGKGTRCYQNTFSNNLIGYKGRDAEMATLLDGNQFQNNRVAIDFLGQNTASLVCQSNSISGNASQVGVQAQSTQSVFSCNRFSGLGTCIIQKDGMVEMGKGAANVFQGKVALSLDDARSVQLIGGLNDFNGIQDQLMDGTLVDSHAFQWNQGVPMLRVDSNFIPTRLLLNPPHPSTNHAFAYWSARNQQFVPAFTSGSSLNLASNSCRNSAQKAHIERFVDQMSRLTTSHVVSNGTSGEFSELLLSLVLDASIHFDSISNLKSLHDLLQLLEDRPISYSNDNAVAIELAEKLAMNWLAMAFEDQLLQYNRAQFGTLPNATVNQLVNILDDLKQEKVMAAELEEASAYDLEKAQVYRLAEHYDYAQQLLMQMRSQASSAQLAESEYWSCVCRAEEQFISGLLHRSAFEDSLASCRSQLPALRKRRFSFVPTELASTPVIATWINGTVLLSGAKLGDSFRIIDIQGRSVKEGILMNSAISNLELPPGMYFFVTAHQKCTLLIP